MTAWALLDDLIPAALVVAAFFAGKALGRAGAQIDLLLASLPTPEPAADLTGVKHHPVAAEAAPPGPDDALAGAATAGGEPC